MADSIAHNSFKTIDKTMCKIVKKIKKESEKQKKMKKERLSFVFLWLYCSYFYGL